MEAPVQRPQSAPVAAHEIGLPRSPASEAEPTSNDATGASIPLAGAVAAPPVVEADKQPKSTKKSTKFSFKNLFKRNNNNKKSVEPLSISPATSEPVTVPETPGSPVDSNTLTQEEVAALPVYGPENKYRKRRAFKVKSSKFSKKTGRGLEVLGRGVVMLGAGVLGVIGVIIVAPVILVGGALFVVITTVAGIVCCPCIAVGTAFYAVAH